MLCGMPYKALLFKLNAERILPSGTVEIRALNFLQKATGQRKGYGVIIRIIMLIIPALGNWRVATTQASLD